MIHVKVYVTLFLLLIAIGCTPKSDSNDLIAFDAILEKHFDAIEQRNLNQLLGTVSKNEIILILPSGKYSSTFEKYKEINQAWFEDPSWKIDFTILNKILGEDIAIALAEIEYINQESNETELNYFLNLTFQKINNEWKLVYDQNTVIMKVE